MHHLLAVLLILSLHLPTTVQAGSLTCTVGLTNAGKPICRCKADRTGSRWQSYPMIVCQLTNR